MNLIFRLYFLSSTIRRLCCVRFCVCFRDFGDLEWILEQNKNVKIIFFYQFFWRIVVFISSFESFAQPVVLCAREIEVNQLFCPPLVLRRVRVCAWICTAVRFFRQQYDWGGLFCKILTLLSLSIYIYIFLDVYVCVLDACDREVWVIQTSRTNQFQRRVRVRVSACAWTRVCACVLNKHAGFAATNEREEIAIND